MTKYTEGPWQAAEGSYGNYIAVTAERGTVARIPWGKDGTEHDNADAHLIAAAPDLLEALYTMLNLEGPARAACDTVRAFDGLDWRYHCDKARAAIAKATT